MEEEKSLLHEVEADVYDAADRPFDFVEDEGETALICEMDTQIREKVSDALSSLGFHITESSSARDALKKMRFHIYDAVILNENFDTQNPETNDVLAYLQNLAMTTRRHMFVALISERYRTMDNMAAFNKSVNLVINPKNIQDIGTILKRGINDNTAFYRVFYEGLRKTGKI
jgi:DNA-binding NtrC family response regulator